VLPNATCLGRAADRAQVNTYTTGYQENPSAASDAAGNFVVAWGGLGQDGNGAGSFGRRYDASGDPRGAECLGSAAVEGLALDRSPLEHAPLAHVELVEARREQRP
jgi:hypothetical protein